MERASLSHARQRSVSSERRHWAGERIASQLELGTQGGFACSGEPSEDELMELFRVTEELVTERDLGGDDATARRIARQGEARIEELVRANEALRAHTALLRMRLGPPDAPTTAPP